MFEASQILWGPCKRKGSEYNRTIRMCNNGAIDYILDGGKRYITRKIRSLCWLSVVVAFVF